ncbi:hypothetical protein J6590_002056 [Homalodisca vitripennis]|nr:hypothetical protein J6590_002056 [Homalodisca vitripennis]
MYASGRAQSTIKGAGARGGAVGGRRLTDGKARAERRRKWLNRSAQPRCRGWGQLAHMLSSFITESGRTSARCVEKPSGDSTGTRVLGVGRLQCDAPCQIPHRYRGRSTDISATGVTLST